VVKVGGGVSRIAGALDAVAEALVAAGRRHRIVVVPGGGPFADAVRAFEADAGLSADAAHWMAILAMDQYAHVLAERLAGATLVDEPGAVTAALGTTGIAVLAPYRWMRAADVLPHSWSASSDSVAAFVAGALDAERLVLIKPVDGDADLVDACFGEVLPRGLPWAAIGWRRAAMLGEMLDSGSMGEAGFRST
jgi:aspartokinase-like uncharacterized kinase